MTVAKKIKFYSLFLTAVVKKQFKIVLGGLLLGILAFWSLPKIYPFIPKPQKILKIGIVGQFSLNSLPSEIFQEISLGLTLVSEKGEPLPGLAESWSVLDEGKTYVFKIKTNGLHWHDGKKFSPEDISYNFKDIEFSTKDNLLTFKLSEPFSAFPTVLAKPIFRKGLIGLGRYKVKKIESSGKYVSSIFLTAFQQNSLPDELYRFYNTEADLKLAFNLGEINEISGVFNLDNLYLSPKVKVDQQVMENAYVGVFFNTSAPPFSSKTFRQALAYSLPKETDEKRALGPIDPRSWAYNPDVKPYNEDLAHAQTLLEGEKLDLGSLKIIIAVFPQFEQTANMLSDSWQKIGINSEVKIISAIPETFDVLIIGREIPKDPDQYYFWHSTQAGNISSFKNPRIDKLLEDGRKTIDKEERKSIYFDFQRYLVEESPVIFLEHPRVYHLSRQ